MCVSTLFPGTSAIASAMSDVSLFPAKERGWSVSLAVGDGEVVQISWCPSALGNFSFALLVDNSRDGVLIDLLADELAMLLQALKGGSDG